MIGTERAALGSTTPTPDSNPGATERALETALRAVARRVRLQRALDAAATLSLAGIGIAALGLCLQKMHDARDARLCLLVACTLPLLGLVLGAFRSVAPLLLARLLDAALGTPDLLASAWAFGKLPKERRTPFMQACMTRAQTAAAHADTTQALRLRRPPALAPAAALALGLAALATFEATRPRLIVARPVHKPRLLQAEDAQAFQAEVAKIVLAKTIAPDVRETARELNALIEALADQKLERAEALAELRGLERRLDAETLLGDQEALREALRELGQALGRDSLAQSVADALREADALKSRAELERLSQTLREQTPKAEALRKLSQALARTATDKADAEVARRLEQARSALQRLLRRQKQDPAQDQQRERLLHDKQRELDRLERQQSERERSQRQLDRLKRELSAAAQSLRAGQAGGGAEHLQRGAEELAKAESSQTSAEQRRQLRERVQQLRELLSKQRAQQAGQANKSGNGEGQRLSLDGFGRAARGQAPNPGKGEGDSKPAGKLLLPGQAAGRSDSTLGLPADPSSQPTLPGTALANSGTDAPGHGGQPESRGDEKQLDSTRVDTRVSGEQRAGPARSEVILEAGQRGFASRSYQRVHGEYERHAEAVLERDEIPGGYRFYVRRYFQLIRPREANDE